MGRSIRIADTTREERIQIVHQALGAAAGWTASSVPAVTTAAVEERTASISPILTA